MRITLALDDDVIEAVNNELRSRSTSNFDEVVDDLLRAGISARREAKTAPWFKVRARLLGLRHALNYDDIGGLLDSIEGTNDSHER